MLGLIIDLLDNPAAGRTDARVVVSWPTGAERGRDDGDVHEARASLQPPRGTSGAWELALERELRTVTY
eukprot:COSAG02_NODE_2150_length_9660_cov_45.377889_17_plen_69_part_00